MDATEYARIADLLRQISLKLDQNCNPLTAAGHMAYNTLQLRLDNVVRALDHAAWMDSKGLLWCPLYVHRVWLVQVLLMKCLQTWNIGCIGAVFVVMIT
jgi:hypothetical protein